MRASPATTLGTFSLDAVSEAANAADGSVTWHYALNNAAAQYLADGQSVSETYTVLVSYGHGSSTTHTALSLHDALPISVSITSGAQSGSVVEDADTTPSLTDSLSATG